MNFSEYRKYLIRRQEVLTRILAFVALLVSLVEVGRLSCHLGVVGRYVSSPVILLIFCFIPVVALFKSRRFTVNYMLMLFFLSCVVSLIFNHPIANYMSTLRLSLFFAMLCLLSPLVDGASLRVFRNYLWRTSIFLCQFVVIMSLVLYVITVVFGDKGRLLLIVSHPIMLSTLAAMVSVIMTWRFLSRENRVSRLSQLFDALSLVAAIIVMVWGGARGAIISFVVAEIYVFVTLSHRLRSGRWVLISVVAAIVFAIFIGGDVTYRVKKKFEIGKENNSIIFSRKQLWKSRIGEFMESPVVGIGFTNATRYSSLVGNVREVCINRPDLSEEPGSSWLSVLSNTGIVGFMLLVCWNAELQRVVRRRRKNGDINAVKYGALMLFFIVDGFFEGWVLYAGSFTFFLYWLLSSRIMDYRWPVCTDKPICGRCLGI